LVGSYKNQSGFTIDTLLDPHLSELHRETQVHLFKFITALFQYLNDEVSAQAIAISVQVIECEILIKISPFFRQGDALSKTPSVNNPMRLTKIAELYNARIMNDSLATGILIKLTI